MAADGDQDRKEYGNVFLDQMRNKSYSLYQQDFAEIYVEDRKPERQEQTVSQPIHPRNPEDEERSRLFLEMRRIYKYPRTINTHGQDVSFFYQQAKMMEHFEDDYPEHAEFSAYFPEYQKMTDEQLRTYFTWRTNVRRGAVEETSLSYVFLYIYELIHNIGVTDSIDGFEKMMYIWKEYGKYEPKLGKYMADWVKDYYITNSFDVSFAELVRQEELLQEYYDFSKEESFFALYAKLSNYRFEKSAFYSADTEPIFRDCFNYVVKILDEWLRENGIYFDDLIYYGHKGCAWLPFEKAVFAMRSMRFPEKKTVRISNAEIYFYENGRWTSSRNRIRRKNGRFLLGYLFRRIEQFYRNAMGFKRKFNADRKNVDLSQLEDTAVEPNEFFAKTDAAILAFYRNSQKVSVTVDPDNLEKIREKALLTQEKLLANPEEEKRKIDAAEQIRPDSHCGGKQEKPEPELAPVSGDPWKTFASSLSDTEREALRIILNGASFRELQAFSRDRFVMPEVLADGINEKAMQAVEDNILEFAETMFVFDEYKKELEGVIP